MKIIEIVYLKYFYINHYKYMTTKGLFLGAVLLVLAIASTLTIFKLFQNKQQLEVKEPTQSQSIEP